MAAEEPPAHHAHGSQSHNSHGSANSNGGTSNNNAAVFQNNRAKNRVVVKVGMLGDSQTGKTTLMVKYVEDRYDEDYIETLGVNFMEKTIKLRNVDVTISVWDLGGQREYLQLMPLVCADAKVLLFVFDLTRRQSLVAIKNWYKEARRENRYFIPFLVGTKFDLFDMQNPQYKAEITRQARKFSRRMKAPLIYCSSSHSINVKKIFKIIVAKVFNLKPRVPEKHAQNEPIIEYNIQAPASAEDGAAATGANADEQQQSQRRRRRRHRNSGQQQQRGDTDRPMSNGHSEEPAVVEAAA